MSRKIVRLGNRIVSHGNEPYIIAEIGINHNGSIETCMKLLEAAKEVGCDAVKFQKRTVDVVYTKDELAKPRENPFGATNGDLKRGLEFSKGQYQEIARQCKKLGLDWFSSCWDEGSVDFMEEFNPICYKIASASLTDDNLLRHHRKTGRPIILSTGMSTSEQIDHAVKVLGLDDLIIMHCTSTYPSKLEELNLSCIGKLVEKYPVPIGYSGHEVGLATTFAAAVLGACVIERHITLDRAMWGSDQSASVEPQGFGRLVCDIREHRAALGDGVKMVYPSEKPIIEKLRRVGK